MRKTRCALGGSIKGKHLAIWGLSFKPQTDDMRESPAFTLIEDLRDSGATICVHDPAAMPEARRRLGDAVRYAESSYDALAGADALVIVTDWNEYRHPSFERMRDALKAPIIVDGRNLYDPGRLRSLGFQYFAIGRAQA